MSAQVVLHTFVQGYIVTNPVLKTSKVTYNNLLHLTEANLRILLVYLSHDHY